MFLPSLTPGPLGDASAGEAACASNEGRQEHDDGQREPPGGGAHAKVGADSVSHAWPLYDRYPKVVYRESSPETASNAIVNKDDVSLVHMG